MINNKVNRKEIVNKLDSNKELIEIRKQSMLDLLETLESIRRQQEFFAFLQGLPPYITKIELEAYLLILKGYDETLNQKINGELITRRFYSLRQIYDYLYPLKKSFRYLTSSDRKYFIGIKTDLADPTKKTSRKKDDGVLNKLVHAGLINYVQSNAKQNTKRKTWNNREYAPVIQSFSYTSLVHHPSIKMKPGDTLQVSEWNKEDYITALETYLYGAEPKVTTPIIRQLKKESEKMSFNEFKDKLNSITNERMSVIGLVGVELLYDLYHPGTHEFKFNPEHISEEDMKKAMELIKWLKNQKD